jgi:protoporphyrinogen oxidase
VIGKKIAIIGGGISGLVIGFYLSKAGFTVTIFEKNKALGGFLESINIGKNKYVEKYYHHFFSCDNHLIGLLTELGLLDKIRWQKTKTANFFWNKIYPYSSLSDSMRYRPISIFSRMRFIFGNLILLCLPTSFFNRLTAKELFDSILGKENWNKLWGILMEKKFGKYSNKVGAPWFISRIKKNVQPY